MFSKMKLLTVFFTSGNILNKDSDKLTKKEGTAASLYSNILVRASIISSISSGFTLVISMTIEGRALLNARNMKSVGITLMVFGISNKNKKI